MLFEITGSVLISFITAFITNIHYSTFYKQSALPVLVLMALSVILFILLSLPYCKKPNFFTKPIMGAMGFFLLLVITYNAFFALLIIVLSIVLARLFSKKTKYTSIVFTENCEMIEIKHTCKVKLGSVLRKSHMFLIPLVFVLMFCTFFYKIPHPLWGIKLFPVAECAKTVPYNSAIASGDVTCCLVYDNTVMLVGDFFDIELPDGTKASPCKEAGLKEGDVITHINLTPALESDFIKKGPTGDAVTLSVTRFSDNEEIEEFEIEVTPVFSNADNAYRLGITYYNAPLAMTSTIQTTTFVLPESGYFAATGHYTAKEVDDSFRTIVFDATVTGSDEEGLSADLGEPIGVSVVNNNYGTFGYVEKPTGKLMPIAKKSEVRLGKATLLSAFEGKEPLEYEVYITGTYRINEKDVLCIAATDERIKTFGGVMRGMSGTPVIQNGKIVGSLCNVDANGFHAYAIFASDMAEALKENEEALEKSMAEEATE